MKVTVITPTADRPIAWPLAERWMSRQTVQPSQWIVADDGVSQAPLTMGQLHIRRKRTLEGGGSLALNILAALPYVTGDAVLVMEDDDYYKPNHIEQSVNGLTKHDAVGGVWLNYYNLHHQKWRRIRNSCAALCGTAIRSTKLDRLESAAEDALSKGIYHVDRLLWSRFGAEGLNQTETVIGIKGLPGTPGIGIGHRPGAGWFQDSNWKQLRSWLGGDSEHYERLYAPD